MDDDTHTGVGSPGPLDSQDAAAERVRALLAQHVPLTLVVDLTSGLPTADDERAERSTPTPAHSGRRHGRGA